MAVDVSEAKVQRNEFGMWLLWTLATTVGMLLGLTIFIPFLDNLDLWLARILVPVVGGFLVGTLQWLVLRMYLTHSADWVLNGGAGWSLGYALGLIIIQILGGSPFGALLAYVLFGLIIAIFQWPVLRREIPNVVPWVLASVTGWALGAYLAQAALNAYAPADPINPVLSSGILSGVTGLVAGAVTGAALVWIVRQPDITEI